MNYEEAFKIVTRLEFNSPRNALHVNEGEEGYTFMGIYQKAHPKWQGWSIIKDLESKYSNIKDLSKACYDSCTLQDLVKDFYKTNFWDKLRLDEVKSAKICFEMFVFGVNAGLKNAVKLAQRVVGVLDDGIIGPKTIHALNNYDEDKFDREYDLLEIQFYEMLVSKRPAFKSFINGWTNRALAV